ncbi:Na+/H+ antiporter NhaA [uncultured Umboniibacter sp.]|uniref:Na+/H+ antiporter NhaA n=1 Tax=uncultured Umboniibacter sp. TaxID=1798917 RepID=UPI002625EE87|nr:Na+/H+ antiporter NhaA [uncultured Umboniibacter sp.]
MLKDFLRWEAAGGMLLVIAMAAAMIVANTPLNEYYQAWLDLIVQIRVGSLDIEKPLLLWINDGLMAVFFLMIGLEVKREVLEGELSSPAQIVLPAFAAVGGMLVPALVYAYFNWGNEAAMAGWAIPTATDIAFALGILSLLGNRVPPALKVFLLALAIMDDLGAIIIIAIFYTSDLSTLSLISGGIALLVLILFNVLNIKHLGIFMIVGTIMWVCVLKSGVHATLAGVALAFTLPLKFKDGTEGYVHKVEHAVHRYVAFMILPIFAFANTGISFSGIPLADAMGSIPVGIAAGLAVGKPIGVFVFAAIPILVGWATLPKDVSWSALFGVGCICGVGLTMSLFIGTLAFSGAGGGGEAGIMIDRIGVLAGSWISAIVGFFVLWLVLPKVARG